MAREPQQSLRDLRMVVLGRKVERGGGRSQNFMESVFQAEADGWPRGSELQGAQELQDRVGVARLSCGMDRSAAHVVPLQLHFVTLGNGLRRERGEVRMACGPFVQGVDLQQRPDGVSVTASRCEEEGRCGRIVPGPPQQIR